VNREQLRVMTDTMIHRGPDDSGQYFDDTCGVGLGFRRLSIIDLSPTGHQPMSNEDRSKWIVFNGEIYNFMDLRSKLEVKGHILHSHTDTETILHQYEEDGVEFVNSLIGMFGLALWDKNLQRMILVRDRIGKKPVFYYDDGERLIFASELKAILCDRSIPRCLDNEALVEYLALGYISSPRTILSGINKLPPGHILTHEKGQLNCWRYWDWLPSFKPDYSLTEKDWKAELKNTLRDVVRDRMISDVPLGAFLSGGIDSSAVVATMASLSDRPIKTFSIGFDNYKFNELPNARLVAQSFKTEHTEFIVQLEAIEDLLPRLVKQFDEPFADSSALPTYYVAKLAKEFVTVCLSGDGGDEALGGYDRYSQAIDEKKVDCIPENWRKTVLNPIVSVLPFYKKGYRKARRLMLSTDERYFSTMQAFYPELIQRLLLPDHVWGLHSFKDAYNDLIHKTSKLDLLSRMQYLDAMMYLPEDILVKVDRTSMLNSLEVRAPLLDYRFLELAAKIPPDLKIKNGIGKYILKETLRGLVPDNIIDGPKRGFGMPGMDWLKGKGNSFINEVLSDRNIIKRGLFHKEVIGVCLDNLYKSTNNYLWHQVWTLLVFELWCQIYLD
jgi:asparagine synthase (glutamine-hydrolysing)